MKRLKPLEARAIIAEEFGREGWQTASTFTVGDGRRPDSETLEWWHENTPANESSETRRSLAYLRAYLLIGGEKLYAGGLFLDRRRLWMDRSVTSRLERDGCLCFEGKTRREPYFVLKKKGEALLQREPLGTD